MTDKREAVLTTPEVEERVVHAIHSYREKLAGLVEGLMCGPSDGDCPNTGCDSLQEVLNIIHTTEIGE